MFTDAHLPVAPCAKANNRRKVLIMQSLHLCKVRKKYYYRNVFYKKLMFFLFHFALFPLCYAQFLFR